MTNPGHPERAGSAPSPAFDRALRAAVYDRFIRSGATPGTEELARILGVTMEVVQRGLARLASAHALVLAPGTGEIWMAMPFSGVATDVTVTVGDRSYVANCAWDGFGIPAVVGQAGTVRSRCPASGRTVEVRVSPDGAVDGDSAVAHFLVPRARWWEDIGYT